jgi:hypothetical protein
MIEVPSQYASWTTEQKRAFLEPLALTAYRAWQDALAIPLDCAPMCEAKYLALKAELDALGGD